MTLTEKASEKTKSILGIIQSAFETWDGEESKAVKSYIEILKIYDVALEKAKKASSDFGDLELTQLAQKAARESLDRLKKEAGDDPAKWTKEQKEKIEKIEEDLVKVFYESAKTQIKIIGSVGDGVKNILSSTNSALGEESKAVRNLVKALDIYNDAIEKSIKISDDFGKVSLENLKKNNIKKDLNVAKESAGDDETKWTEEQRLNIEKLRAAFIEAKKLTADASIDALGTTISGVKDVIDATNGALDDRSKALDSFSTAFQVYTTAVDNAKTVTANIATF